MQALACIANELGKAGFDVEVYVFEFEFPLKSAAFDFLPDLCKALRYGLPVFGTDDALLLQHVGVCERALYVGLPEAFIEKYTGGVALHEFAHGLGKEG